MTKLNGVDFVVKTPVPCETSGKITICIEQKLGGSTLFSKIVFSSGREGEFYCHKFYRRSTIFWYFHVFSCLYEDVHIWNWWYVSK